MSEVMGKLVWKDSSTKAILILILIGLIPSLFLSSLVYFLYHKLLGIIAVILSLGFFVWGLNKREKTRIVVYSSGISMGDANFVGKGDVEFKTENIFFSWNEIRSLKIKGHVVYGSFVGYPVPFLFLRTKRKLYKFGIMDPKGFVNALKEIGKIHLLDERARKRYEK